MERPYSDEGKRARGREPATALQEALRFLARRPLTEAEVRARLTRKGFAEPQVDAATARCRELGYLNDASLALDFIVARANRLGHGRLRLLRDLERRGVDRSVARRAMETAIDEASVSYPDLLRQQVKTRVDAAGGRLEPRSYRRVYNALLRRGFETSAIVSALDPFYDPGTPRD